MKFSASNNVFSSIIYQNCSISWYEYLFSGGGEEGMKINSLELWFKRTSFKFYSSCFSFIWFFITYTEYWNDSSIYSLLTLNVLLNSNWENINLLKSNITFYTNSLFTIRSEKICTINSNWWISLTISVPANYQRCSWVGK